MVVNGGQAVSWLQGKSVFQIPQHGRISELTETGHTHKTHRASKQTKSQHWKVEVDTVSHPQSRSYLPLIPARNEKAVFSNGLSLGILSTLQGKPYDLEGVSQHNYFVYLLCHFIFTFFVLLIFFCFLWFICFNILFYVFSFCVVFERERESAWK